MHTFALLSTSYHNFLSGKLIAAFINQQKKTFALFLVLLALVPFFDINDFCVLLPHLQDKIHIAHRHHIPF